MQFLEGEMCFHDACGLHPGPQNVLLCGDVVWLAYPLQVVKVAEEKTHVSTHFCSTCEKLLSHLSEKASYDMLE